MSNTRHLILPGGGGGRKKILTNPITGRRYPCCYLDCDVDADDRVQVQVPHSQPRWRDEATGKQEMLIYTFCTEEHKRLYLVGSPLADRH